MSAAEAARPVSTEEANQLFEPLTIHAHVALAVSGGSDSIAMMWLVARWAGALKSAPKLGVLTVDHGLRPDSGKEARQVVAWAEKLGLAAHVLAWEGSKPATGLQAQARAARYRLLRRWCGEQGAAALLTAHTLDDQAETFLMRLARGSGIDGLAAIAGEGMHQGVWLERPLLAVSRARLQATLRAAGQSWLDDPSNADNRFERVRMRKALPVLAELGISPAAIARSAARLGRAAEPLISLSQNFVRDSVDLRPEGFAIVDLARLQKLDDEIAIRVLASLLPQVGGRDEPARLMAVEALHHWLRRGERSARTLAGCRIVRRQRHLLIGREPGRIDSKPVAVAPGEGVVWDNRFAIRIAGGRGAIVPVAALGGIFRNPKIPGFVQAALPAILVDGEIAAIPSLGFTAKGVPHGFAARADFRPREP